MCHEAVLMDAAMCDVFQELRMVKGRKPHAERVWVSRLSIGHATGNGAPCMQSVMYQYSFRGADRAGVLECIINSVLNVDPETRN
jgi:hypothetical protein